ncbi:TPA: GNAT family N-acetyltransferase [Methanosarcina acetivorans]|uniref:Acetyltransferase (GNAT) family protein n=2 Tax=Methanosarcina acetivorans TaxID=2214 RepID=Q8TJX3_METAC|nr:GNAT family N-acetyltransferase [Methanosarcina acetivorans]AAM07009.1 acetyltransferase (GNAT) family protein [Methanosarcina acetivorans C2A]HIH93801.1 GNAT family N-acetyltransferase [Methanosarcina acetivorans]
MIDMFPMEKGEEQETYELIVRVFHKYVAPVYSENGVARFLGMLSPEGLSEMNNGKNSFVIVARDQSKIIGMISVINDSHIALFFVSPRYQGKGIGKNILDEAIKNCLNRNPELSAVTVSSSPNSKSFYEEAGFEVIGNEINEEGLRFTPMRKLLRQ